jgi:uncharacterized protein (DUF58 family)
MRFLDPKILRAVANIELRARLLVEGMYASRHRSPFYGFSVEFVDHREYAPGDEPRTIDWKMLARTERYFVKRFEMESNMNVVCLLDTSRSMGYAAGARDRLTKLEYASYLAASVAFLVHRQQDSPGLATFGDELREFVPPKQGQRHLYTLLSRLEAIEPQGQTDLARVLEAIGRRLTRRGIVLVISDCYGDPRRVVDGIRHLAARGHDLIVVQLMDHDEVAFPFKPLTTFRDMESGAALMSDPLRQRPLYLQRLERFRRAIEEGSVACGADYRFVDTSQPIELVLRDYLLYRRERAR